MAIRVKNWREFQHYRDRDPKWIKLYRRWLDDEVFHELPLASRALAPMLWLLASESMEGLIDLSTKQIAWRLRQPEQDIEQALKPLIDNGFFVVEQNASNSLAACNKDDSASIATCLLRDRVETEKETEKEAKPDHFDLVSKIWHLYPSNLHRKNELQLPRYETEAIINAIARDGEELVLSGVQAYRKATDLWPKCDRQFIRDLGKWFNASDYRKDPAEWEKKPAAGQSPKVGYVNPLDVKRRMTEEEFGVTTTHA